MAVGPFLVSEPIAAGGMASIHLAARRGSNARVLALKSIHPAMDRDERIRNMLLDEGAINSYLRHPNVVTTYGVANVDERLFLVMDYVEGVALHRLMRERAPGTLPPRVVVAIVAAALRGLHAAHEAVDDQGRSLGIVHQDVSPQNILVGADGQTRIIDFGVAKAAGQRAAARRGDVRGKLAYMAPEQLSGGPVDRRADVFAAGIVMWEALTGRTLFHACDELRTLAMLLEGCQVLPSQIAPRVPHALDAVVGRALEVAPAKRFPTALAMAEALEAALSPAEPAEIGCWVGALGADTMRAQSRIRFALERRVATVVPDVATLPCSQRASLPTVVAPPAPPPAPVVHVFLVGLIGAVCFLAALLATAGAGPLTR
jgi:serine/threonine-protein kinase